MDSTLAPGAKVSVQLVPAQQISPADVLQFIAEPIVAFEADGVKSL